MRLGDLDALKEELSGEDYQTWTHEYGYAIPTEWVMNAIDNAPTVQPLIKPIAEIKVEARLQGKWIKIFENPFTNGYMCPFCGHRIQVTEQFLPEVTECEVCGAELEGDTSHA